MTHGIARTGAGGTAALAVTQIGADLTLPAGGPWNIFAVWSQVAKVTTVPNEGTGGDLVVNSVSGDIVPDPAPGQYPIIGSVVSESANSNIAVVPLNVYPVNWQAPGKAVLNLWYRNQLAITTASQVACGILFGEATPEKRPLVFVDTVRTAFASATEQAVGTITLSEKATRIVGILNVLGKGDAPTAGEEVVATVRLASDDISLPPAQYPCCFAYNASDGTAVGQASQPWSEFIPLDIPVIGGSRIQVFATTTISVTGNAEVRTYIAYE